LLHGRQYVRGFDIRSIDPHDLTSGIVTGGNKTLLFSMKYTSTSGPVRLIGF
jgi:hypothetical protein